MVVSPAPPAAQTLPARSGNNRENKEALVELKNRLDVALSRLNDQDTQRTGMEEIREFLHSLYPDWFTMVIVSIGEAGTNLKPLGRCESVKLLGLLAELHGDAVIPLLQRMLQVVLTRLQDADLHLREACAETVFRLTRALVVDADASPVFAALLKPLFAALTEHNKWVQIGAASCICAVIQGAPPAVLSENLGRLCARLVQHLSLPLAMARPQLLSACIHVMQAVSLAEFDELLPSLMPCIDICLNSTSDWQTRKQAVEVLQAVGDHSELGTSLQIPQPADASVRPSPLQKRLAAMMEGLREDKVRAVREAVKDVLLRWSVTVKAAPSPTSTLPGEKSDRPLRSSSPCAAHAAAPAEREVQSCQRFSGVSVRSSSPGPTSWDRDQARLSEGSFAAQGPRQARTVRAATRDRDLGQSVDIGKLEAMRPKDDPQEDRIVDKQERQDAATEKAARNIAVKNALSNADLSATKKPRPKRERVSIFSQQANVNFFQQTASQPQTNSDEVEDVVVGLQGIPAVSEDRLLSSGGSDRGGAFPVNSENEDERSDAGGVLDPAADAAVQEPVQASVAELEVGSQRQLANHDEDLQPLADEAEDKKAGIGVATRAKPKPAPHRGRPKQPEDRKRLSGGDEGETVSPSPSSSMPIQPEQDTASSCQREEDKASSSAPLLWEDLPTGAEQPEAPDCTLSPSRPAAEDEESALFSHVQALSSRLAAIEEDKRRSERQMTERLQQLVKTCEGQGELIATQQRRLEAQEQQMQLMEERLAQQDDELAQMDQQLQEQQLQLQHQDQRLEQNDQQLNEHQQQLEQQEQELEKQALLTDTLVNSAASSSSILKPAKQAWPEEEGKPTTGNPAKRWQTESWKPDGVEAIGVLNSGSGQLPADGAVMVGSGGTLAGSSSERPLALVGRGKVDATSVKLPSQKAGTQLWESVMELCSERRFLEAYKQVIAEPEETCLLRLMKHTGPIVDRLDAESNSRLIRRLIHILSSPAKEPAAASIEQIFSWLWQALNQGIHFTASQVEDLVSALHKVSSAQSPLSAPEKAEAAQLLQQVSAHRRV